MKAALIFAEMRGQVPHLADNVTAHKIYKLWREVRQAEMEDGDLIAATKMLGTDELSTFAMCIYAAGQTSEEKL